MKVKIQNARLYDGMETVREHADVLFDESGILAVGTVEEGADMVVDGTGKTLIPGLFDCHVHLGGTTMNQSCPAESAMAVDQIHRILEYGITTVRCCGAPDNVDILVRDMEKRGDITGARVIASGLGITTTGGHGWWMCHQCDSVEEVRKAARIQLRDGADQVKLFASGGMGTKGSNPDAGQLTLEEMRAAVEEANQKNALTCAHATGLTGAALAIEAGVRTIEHTQLTREMTQRMKELGTYYCSTIVTRYGIIHSTDEAHAWIRGKAKENDIPNMLAAIAYCKEYGVPMGAGTDAGFDDLITPLGSSLHKELWLYTQAGLTPMEALHTATGGAAEMCMVEKQTGTIVPGLCADLVLIDGNPLEDITQLANVAMTFHRGRAVYAAPRA